MTAPTRLLFATFSAAIAVMTFQSLRKSVHNEMRAPAAQSTRVKKPLQSASETLNRKPQMGFTLTLRGDTVADGSAQLTANVRATKSMSSHKFSWILPAGVSQISGPPTGDVPKLEAGDSVDFTARFKGVSATSPVVIHVYTDVTGETIGQVAQWGTNTVSAAQSTAQSIVKPDGMVQ